MTRKMYFSYISEAAMPNITTFFTAFGWNTHSIAHCNRFKGLTCINSMIAVRFLSWVGPSTFSTRLIRVMLLHSINSSSPSCPLRTSRSHNVSATCRTKEEITFKDTGNTIQVLVLDLLLQSAVKLLIASKIDTYVYIMIIYVCIQYIHTHIYIFQNLFYQIYLFVI